jgi:hypothetical protein
MNKGPFSFTPDFSPVTSTVECENRFNDFGAPPKTLSMKTVEKAGL